MAQSEPQNHNTEEDRQKVNALETKENFVKNKLGLSDTQQGDKDYANKQETWT